MQSSYHQEQQTQDQHQVETVCLGTSLCMEIVSVEIFLQEAAFFVGPYLNGSSMKQANFQIRYDIQMKLNYVMSDGDNVDWWPDELWDQE